MFNGSALSILPTQVYVPPVTYDWQLGVSEKLIIFLFERYHYVYTQYYPVISIFWALCLIMVYSLKQCEARVHKAYSNVCWPFQTSGHVEWMDEWVVFIRISNNSSHRYVFLYLFLSVVLMLGILFHHHYRKLVSQVRITLSCKVSFARLHDVLTWVSPTLCQQNLSLDPGVTSG